MNTIRNKLLIEKQKGISIKYIANETGIPVKTLYNFIGGQNISEDKQNRLKQYFEERGL